MGTLTMALAAALLAGSAPEKVSGETRQGLDLRGEWQGSLFAGTRWARARYAGGILFLDGRTLSARFVDQGRGLLRIRWGDRPDVYGAYRREGDRVTITTGMRLLVLRRIRPRK